jgi:hypothetical protein
VTAFHPVVEILLRVGFYGGLVAALGYLAVIAVGVSLRNAGKD